MKNDNPNIENHDFPEELNYTEANWEQALDLIEGHERAVRRRRILSGLFGLCVLLIAVVGYNQYGQDKEAMASNKHTNAAVDTKEHFEKNINIERENKTIAPTSNSSNKHQTIPRDHNKDLAPKEEGESLIDDKFNTSSTVSITHTMRGKGDPKVDSILTTNRSVINLREHNDGAAVDDTPMVNTRNEDDSIDLVVSTENKTMTNEDEKKLVQKSSGIEQAGESTTQNNMEAPKDRGTTESVKPNGIGNKLSTGSYSNRNAANNSLSIGTLMRPKMVSQIHNISNVGQPVVGYRKLPKFLETKVFSIPLEYLSVKVGISPWLQYGKDKNWSGLNMTYGLEYGRNFSNKFAVSLGMDYFFVSAIPLVLKSENTSYNYGYESVITSVTTDKMEFISLPIRGSYRWMNRIQFSAGMGASYLITVRNTLKQTKQTNTETNELSSDRTSGYMQGYNRLNTYSSLGVNYWITELINLDATFNFGMSDLTKNDAFRNDTRDANSKIIFSLKKIIK